VYYRNAAFVVAKPAGTANGLPGFTPAISERAVSGGQTHSKNI